jgi:enoyl-CoA hydratase
VRSTRESPNDKNDMVDFHLSPENKVAIERRGQILLIGIDRPQPFNRVDPDAFYGLAQAQHDFEIVRAGAQLDHGDGSFPAIARSPSTQFPF